MRGELRQSLQPLTVRGDHDVGDVATDHVVRVERDGADLRARREFLENVDVRVIEAQQRQLRQRRAEQRCRYQSLAELLDYDGSIGEFAARTAEFLGHHQGGSTHLLAQQLPQ